MKPATDDLVHRRAAWEALSGLFLDTELAVDRPFRAQQLAATPYTLEELEAILINEVEPVCRWNFFAGRWGDFEADWLERHILRRLRWPRCLRYPSFAKYSVPNDEEWVATKLAIVEVRSEK